MDGSLVPFYGLLTRRVQRARLAAIAPHIQGAALVLDVGCGLTDLPGRMPGYVGCDRNAAVLAESRRRFPAARFVEWDVAAGEPPAELRDGRGFDVVLMAALLEHLNEPWRALGRAASLLGAGGRIVATTPHPWGRLPLQAGAALGLLSHAADEEHETLLDRAALEEAGAKAGLALEAYGRFLLGLNQLAVFRLP